MRSKYEGGSEENYADMMDGHVVDVGSLAQQVRARSEGERIERIVKGGLEGTNPLLGNTGEQDMAIAETGVDMDHEPQRETAPINADTRGCMDGRSVILRAVLRADGRVEMLSTMQESATVIEAQLPGADLGLVALVQDAGVMGTVSPIADNADAVRFVGSTLRSMDLQPQFHVDNHHGGLDIPEDISPDDLKKLLEELTDGCGFAGLIWREQAGEVIAHAKDDEWAIEILDGHHNETVADEVEESDRGIDRTKSGGRRFGFTPAHIRPILQKMETELQSPGFAERAETWLRAKFAAVAGKISDGKITEPRII